MVVRNEYNTSTSYGTTSGAAHQGGESRGVGGRDAVYYNICIFPFLLGPGDEDEAERYGLGDAGAVGGNTRVEMAYIHGAAITRDTGERRLPWTDS